MKPNRHARTLLKVLKVIQSCETLDQLSTAGRMVQNFQRSYGCCGSWLEDAFGTLSAMKNQLELIDGQLSRRETKQDESKHKV